MKIAPLLLILLICFHAYAQKNRSYPLPETESLEVKEDEKPLSSDEVDALFASGDVAAFAGSLKLFLNPDMNYGTVFRDPGLSYLDCEKDESRCFAWPDGEADIERVAGRNIVEKEVRSSRTGRKEWRQFVYVKYKYTRDGVLKQGEGWMDTSYLRAEKKDPLYKIPKVKSDLPEKTCPKESCPPKVPTPTTPTQRSNIWAIGTLADFLKQDYKTKILQSSEALRSYVGKCPIQPAHDKSKHQSKWRKKNIYDEEVMPVLNKMKNQVPNIPKEICSNNNKPVATGKMDWNDLVNIDAMARTIYSEMNECFDVGLEYPMAAAKVAMNRAEIIDRKDKNEHWKVFLKSWWHKEEKPTLAKALTADRQFSVWNYMSGPQDKTILMALCPARYTNDSKKTYYAANSEDVRNWKGSPTASNRDLTIWSQAMQIATEAVLYSCSFKERTQQIKQKYYTSKMNDYDRRQRPSPAPKIDGRRVESFRCMYLWEGR